MFRTFQEFWEQIVWLQYVTTKNKTVYRDPLGGIFYENDWKTWKALRFFQILPRSRVGATMATPTNQQNVAETMRPQR